MVDSLLLLLLILRTELSHDIFAYYVTTGVLLVLGLPILRKSEYWPRHPLTVLSVCGMFVMGLVHVCFPAIAIPYILLPFRRLGASLPVVRWQGSYTSGMSRKVSQLRVTKARAIYLRSRGTRRKREWLLAFLRTL